MSRATVEALVDEIMHFGRALRISLSNADDGPLPLPLEGVLQVLANNGECRQNELAANLCISQSALSRQVSELVELGLVSRQPDPADGRASRVQATAEGLALLASSRSRRAVRLRELLGEWEQDDAASAVASLGQLTETFLNDALPSEPTRRSSNNTRLGAHA